MIAAFRRHSLLPMNACRLCFSTLNPAPDSVGAASVFAMIWHLAPAGHQREQPSRRQFKRYPIRFFHIAIAEVQTAAGKFYLFAGIDLTRKYAATQLVDKTGLKTAWEFLEQLHFVAPYKPHHMPDRRQFPRPIMSARAGFDDDETGLQSRGERQHLRSPPAQNRTFRVPSVNLEDVLGQIESDGDRLVHGWFPSGASFSDPPWHNAMPLAGHLHQQ
nr:hypothetical protein [Paracoccus sp. SM22M-07]